MILRKRARSASQTRDTYTMHNEWKQESERMKKVEEELRIKQHTFGHIIRKKKMEGVKEKTVSIKKGK